MAAFYCDAAPVARRYKFEGSDQLRTDGMKADMLFAGAAPYNSEEIVRTFECELPALNAHRIRRLESSRRQKV